MKRKTILIILLITTILSGCATPKSKVFDKFNELFLVTQTDDLETLELYDKEGYKIGGGVSERDIWGILIERHYETEENKINMDLRYYFNKKTNDHYGTLEYSEIPIELLNESEIEEKYKEEYPIKYENKTFVLVDDNIEENRKKLFNQLVTFFNELTLTKEEFQKKKEKNITYNPLAPIYGISYKMNEEDKIYQLAKKIFDHVKLNEEKSLISFTRWTSQGLSIYFDLETLNGISLYVYSE